MTKSKLRSAIVGVVLSHMAEYDNIKLDVILTEGLYKDIKSELEQMYTAWWRTHFPYFHFTLTIQLLSVSEPRVILNWCPNTNQNTNWDRLTFMFNPARLTGDVDPIMAFDRAMSVV